MDLDTSSGYMQAQPQQFIYNQSQQQIPTVSLDQQIRSNISSMASVEEEKVLQLFSGNEYDGDRNICHSESTAGDELANTQTKAHFIRLFSLPLPIDIKIEVQNKILAGRKRTHVINDEMLCAYTIRVYVEKQLPFDIYQLYNIFGLNPSKCNVSELLSNCTTKQTLLSEEQTSISVMVIKPKDYIKTTVNEYLAKCGINIPYKDKMIEKIEYFAEVLVATCNLLLNNTPLDVASAIVFFYIDNGSYGVKKTQLSKKQFYTLNGVTKIKFEESLALVKRCYDFLSVNRPDIKSYIYDYNV